MTIDQMIMQISLLWFSLSVIVVPIAMYFLMKGEFGKRLKYWLTKTKYVKICIINADNKPRFDLLKTRLEGTKTFVRDGKNEYAYSPIASGFGIVENGNALPFVVGGYIEEITIKKGLDATKTKTTTENIMNPKSPTDESNVQIIYKWVINDAPQELKKVLIRPFVKWSSHELYQAIESKVIDKLLTMPMSSIEILMFFAILCTAIIGIYYGMQTNNNLQAMQKTLSAIQNATKGYTIIK